MAIFVIYLSVIKWKSTTVLLKLFQHFITLLNFVSINYYFNL